MAKQDIPQEVLDYQPLERILSQAYAQAANGKGRKRHARNKPFLKQPIMEIGRMVGSGYAAGQAMKKVQEAVHMGNREEFPAAKAEILGAINYLAALYILVEEEELATTGGTDLEKLRVEHDIEQVLAEQGQQKAS